MIIEALMNLVSKILSAVISQFNVPAAPADFANSIPQFFSYLEMSASLVSLVLPINLKPFLAITLIIIAVEHGYPLIMWILRKIPFLGIK